LSEIKLRRQPFVYHCEPGRKSKVCCRRGRAQVGNFADTARLIADMVPRRFVVPGSGGLGVLPMLRWLEYDLVALMVFLVGIGAVSLLVASI
jgi:hypothetical protein